jgi:hypothetical protein
MIVVTVLVIGVALLAAGNMFLSARYYFSLKQLEKLQPHINAQGLAIREKLAVAQAFVNETLDYGRSNATVLAILERYDLRPRGGGGSSTVNNAPAAAPKAAAN